MTDASAAIDANAATTVTLLIAAYNSEPYLQRTLDSIRAQSFQGFRCLISDDVSTDRTAEIVERIASTDSRFVLLRNASNLGWIGNVNRLLDRVDSEFYMLMPHDDTLEPRYLEALVAALRANPDAVLAVSDLSLQKLDGGKETHVFQMPPKDYSARQRAAHLMMLPKVRYWYVAYRGLVRAQIAGRGLRLRRSSLGEPFADRTWILELAMRGRFVHCPETLYNKYHYKESVSMGWKKHYLDRIANLQSCMEAVRDGPLDRFGKWQLWTLLAFKIALEYRHHVGHGVRRMLKRGPDRGVSH